MAEAAAPSAAFSVGVSRVDVTPPPGAALFGHGPGGRVAVGHWLRLYCRAYYLERAALPEEPLAWVSCELPMVSTHLQQSVANYVNEQLAEAATGAGGDDGATRLDATRLMMTATHTHAGPGHYLGVKNLNGYTSSPHPGFDPKMVEFLVRRIGDAILAARDDRQPAEMRWVRGELLGLARNAALWQRLMREQAPASGGAGCDRSHYPEDMREIDPALRLLEFRRLDSGAPLGGLALYALHPTFIGNRNRYYHGDVFGVAARLVEQELRRQWVSRCEDGLTSGVRPATIDDCTSDPVFALVNTNQADAQPARVSGNQDEVRRFAEVLATAILTAHLVEASDTDRGRHSGWGERHVPLALDPESESPPALCGPLAGPWTSTPELGRRYVQVWLPNARVPDEPAQRLCPRGEMGWGSTKGSPSNPTVIRLIAPSLEDDVNWDRAQAHRRGKRGVNDRCQHPKATLQAQGFSREVPLALLRLDDTFVSFVPAEVTAAAGAAINARVLEVSARAWPGVRFDAVVAGLANGYLSYVTTEAEYAAQAYHGASTLYGPHTAAFLAGSYGCLAGRLLDLPQTETRCNLPGRHKPAAFDRVEAIAPHRHPQRKRLWRHGWDRGAPTHGGEDDFLCQLPHRGMPGQATGGVDVGVAPAALPAVASTPSPAVHIQLCFGWHGAGPYAAMVGRQAPSEFVSGAASVACPGGSVGEAGARCSWVTRLERRVATPGPTTAAVWEPLALPVRPLLAPSADPDRVGAWRERPITTWADDTGLAFTTRVHDFHDGRWRWSTVVTLSAAEWNVVTEGPVRIVTWDGASREFAASNVEDCRVHPERMRRYCLVEN